MVPPTDSTDISREEEREMRTEVLYGLKLAVEDTIGDDTRDLTKTEREKFLYFAIRDLDLPLTYSWYLAGAKTYSNTSPQPSSPTVQAREGEEYGGIQTDTSEISDNAQKYRDYFRDTTFFNNYDLSKIIFTSQAEFLCDFYEECADEKYTDLYIHSTRLREKLKQLEENLTRNSENESLTAWGGGTDDKLLSQNQEEEIRRLISHLHIDLAQLEGFEETRKHVTAGTDVVENVLTKLTHLSTINEHQMGLVKDLDNFFFNVVWKYPALKISVETSSGPNETEYKEKHLARFNQFSDVLQTRVERAVKKHRDAGLEPAIEDFNTNEDNKTMQYFHEMTKSVVDPEQ